MLTGIPLLHYFKNKNQYSGAHNGMRYLFTPLKKSADAADGAKVTEEVLSVTIWPDPWSLERTDPALRTTREFPFTEEGRQQAIEWLSELYTLRQQEWENCPSILDSTPWYPSAQSSEEEKG